MSSTAKQNTPHTGDIDDDLKRAKDDNDPQTVFYLNSISAAQTSQQAPDASKEDILTTVYSWATKIEHTVQRNLGKGSDAERHTLQASWDRAAYRVKLIDYLTRTTPWLMEACDNPEAPSDEKLTGEYHHDKLVYQQATHGFFRASLAPDIPVDKLRTIERYIAETMVLGQDKLAKDLRFALAFPLLTGTAPVLTSAIRVITLTFTPKVDNQSNKTVAITKTLYEANLNKKLFDKQEFDQKLLDAGKKLVQDATFDFVR
ncbi:hypothetical protein F5Y13DRAFT_189929 [Hypoxylon sp. FL1857]|nr:hypothetical protein F5Y13DRAFT_189929 [Hypoxylon sp. FL1857]